jgi:outer membrane protein OmpA-like peptidoglycan-associated protein
MKIRTALAVLGLVVSLSGIALGQAAGGDTNRRTIAVTFPEKGRIRLLMQGTTASPKGNGAAEVRRLRGLTQVEIELDDMVPAYLLGSDYATYVMWAITPQGHVENLGEFRLSGSRSKLRATTPYQTISLIITAEPHFAVKTPSRKVILENIPPTGPGVTVQTTEIFFQGDSGRYFSNQQLPEVVQKDWAKQPIELLEARLAVNIAKLAGAERHANKGLSDAQSSLQQADDAYNAGDRDNAAFYGRKAILEAQATRELAEFRAERAAQRSRDAQKDAAVSECEQKNLKSLETIDDLEAQVKVEQSARQRAEDEAERAHEENATLRVEARNMKSQLDDATEDLSQLRNQFSQLEKQRQADSLATQRDQAYRTLNEMLRPLATLQQDTRGFKVVLPDTLFVAQKSTLGPKAPPKLNPIAAVILSQPSVQFVIESYADDKSGPDGGMQLSQERGQAIGDFLTSMGIDASRYSVTGYGPANPVAPNKTLRGRASNRRVELVFLKP